MCATSAFCNIYILYFKEFDFIYNSVFLVKMHAYIFSVFKICYFFTKLDCTILSYFSTVDLKLKFSYFGLLDIYFKNNLIDYFYHEI